MGDLDGYRKKMKERKHPSFYLPSLILLLFLSALKSASSKGVPMLCHPADPPHANTREELGFCSE